MWRSVCSVGCTGALLLVGACGGSAPEAPALEGVPLPRPRPALTARGPKPKPSPPVSTSSEPEVDWRNAEAVKKWTLCKLLFAEAMARRTDRPTEEILGAATEACASQEEQAKAWLAQQGMSARAAAQAMAIVRAGDREQVASRVAAARQLR